MQMDEQSTYDWGKTPQSSLFCLAKHSESAKNRKRPMKRNELNASNEIRLDASENEPRQRTRCRCGQKRENEANARWAQQQKKTRMNELFARVHALRSLRSLVGSLNRYYSTVNANNLTCTMQTFSQNFFGSLLLHAGLRECCDSSHSNARNARLIFKMICERSANYKIVVHVKWACGLLSNRNVQQNVSSVGHT